MTSLLSALPRHAPLALSPVDAKPSTHDAPRLKPGREEHREPVS